MALPGKMVHGLKQLRAVTDNVPLVDSGKRGSKQGGNMNELKERVSGIVDQGGSYIHGLSRKFWNSTVVIAHGVRGNVNIGSMVLMFIGAMMIFGFIPGLIEQNAVVQADANADNITKLFSGFLVWALPAGAIGGIILGAMRLFKGD